MTLNDSLAVGGSAYRAGMRVGLGIWAGAALAALSLSACGQSAGVSSSSTSSSGTISSGSGSVSAAAPARHRRRSSHRTVHHRSSARHASATARGGLSVSRASAHVLQPQPAPGSCHARGSGLYSLPDPRCTPGALNPAVSQATIDATICVSGYSGSVRPPESVSEAEKRASMSAYGDAGPMSGYEYDHLVSLELGGAANDSRNLWPEPAASPNPKDSVENELHRMVCDGQMPLARAQHIIATDWIAWASGHTRPAAPAGHPRPAAPGTRSAAPTHHAASGPAAPRPAPVGPDKPISEVNCSDFPTHAAAQRWFAAHGGSASNDVAGLDGDGDGIACESLP